MYNKEASYKCRNKNLRQGLCGQCGKEPLHTKNHCKGCAQKHNARVARYNYKSKLRNNGLCTNCGKEPLFTKDRCKKCRDEHCITTKKQNLRYKKACFDAYGGCKCVHCGMNDIDVLTLDHINGGGYADKQKGRNSGIQIYLYLKRNNYPPGFQVLCFNCNMKKHLLSLRSEQTQSN